MMSGGAVRRWRRSAPALACAAAAVVAIGCTGRTTGATHVTDRTAKLNAVGSCDTQCQAYLRWRKAGTSAWTNGPVINVGRVTDAPFAADPEDLTPDTPYEYQACGKEQSYGELRLRGAGGPGQRRRDVPDDRRRGAPAARLHGDDRLQRADPAHRGPLLAGRPGLRRREERPDEGLRQPDGPDADRLRRPAVEGRTATGTWACWAWPCRRTSRRTRTCTSSTPTTGRSAARPGAGTTPALRRPAR